MLIRVTMDYVKSKITQHPVFVFSKSYCPYCDKAKQALDNLGAKYEVEEIESRPDVDDIQTALGELTGARTVPRVFIGGKCIGGGSETSNLHRSGKLAQMLKAVGAL